MSAFTFHRSRLAEQLIGQILGEDPLVDQRNGLFLAAPRRVGKTTFLRQDLIPAAKSAGLLTVYVDLWSERDTDPAILIADAIKHALAMHSGKLGKALGVVKSIAVGGIKVELERRGLPDGLTLPLLIQALLDKAQRRLVLIIDEAQHALVSDAGIAAMFALKSARDTLNTAGASPRLMLVMTGSHRHKLAHLVTNKRMPFFGSRVTDFPLLGRDFTDAFTAWVNTALSPELQVDPGQMHAAFVLIGHRPEMLRQVLGEAIQDRQAATLSDWIKTHAETLRARAWADYEDAYASLTKLQQAILNVLICDGTDFSPFASHSLERYARHLNQADLSTASAQSALDQLCELDIVWKSARGVYQLEDQGLEQWYRSVHLPD